MFQDDDQSEKLEMIRVRKDALEERANHLGLYMQHWEPGLAVEQVGEGDETITHGAFLKTTFVVGNLALSKRVQDPEAAAMDEEFVSMMIEHDEDRAIDIVQDRGETIRRMLDDI